VIGAKTAVMAVTLVLAIGLAACGHAPDLPNDDASTYQLITGSGGREFLLQISNHDWDDGGAAAAARLSWIGHDAQSADATTAQRAGEAAHAIATFLAQNADELSRVPSGWFGLQHHAVGELNPELVRGYASLLVPFQGALVGDVKSVRGFTILGDGVDLSPTRKVVAVIDTNTQAGNEFKDAAYQRVQGYLRTYAGAVVNRNTDELVALRHAADLAGVVAGGQHESGNGSIEPETAQHWINWAGYEVAAAMGAGPGDPDIPVQYFASDGRLTSPDQVSANDLRTFATALENFTFNHGFPGLGSDFQRWYHDAAGK
jgi:hypothetical protein